MGLKLKICNLTRRQIRGDVTTRSRIIVFDLNGLEEIKDIVLNGVDPGVVDYRGTIYAGAKTLWNFIRLIVRPRNRRPTGLPKKALSRIKIFYWAAVVKASNANTVITFIDNAIIFHQISAIFPELRFIAIQNGVRGMDSLRGLSSCPISEYWGFSRRVGQNLTAAGADVLRFEVVGSLRAIAFYKFCKSHFQIPKSIPFDIVIPSQWSQDESPTLLKELEDVYDYLLRDAISKDMKVGVICRTKSINEKNYFEKFGNHISVLSRDEDPYFGYRMLYRGRLVLTYFSTLAVEALQLGRPTLFVDPFGKNICGVSDTNRLVLKGLDASKFRDTIKKLLLVSELEFEREFTNDANEFVEQADQLRIKFPHYILSR